MTDLDPGTNELTPITGYPPADRQPRHGVPHTTRPPLPTLPRAPRPDFAVPTTPTSALQTAPAPQAPPVVLDEAPRLTEADYRVVSILCDRVSTRLTAEDTTINFHDRREQTRAIATEELSAWILENSGQGQPVPEARKEAQILRAVIDQIDGLGRLAPLMERDDIEDIHIDGANPVMLRLTTGQLVASDPIGDSDDQVLRILQSLGERAGDKHQAARELSTSQPFLPVRIRSTDPTEIGGRLQAVIDVVPRPSAMIRMHRIGNPSLADHYRRRAIDFAAYRFLCHAVLGRASMLVTGTTGVGKTSTLRALCATIPWDNVVVTVEDERELGMHLPVQDPATQRWRDRYAVCRPFESRLPNAEGRGAVEMQDALHAGLRLGPTWTIVGEVRGGYVLTMLDAVTSGISPVMCTIHAPAPADIFNKVLLNALKNDNPPSTELAMHALAGIDLVIHCERNEQWDRYVAGIYEVGPVNPDTGYPSLVEIFGPRHDGRATASAGFGSLSTGLQRRLLGTGYQPEWLTPGSTDWDDTTEQRARTISHEETTHLFLDKQATR